MRGGLATLIIMVLGACSLVGAAQSTQAAQNGFCFHGSGVSLPIGRFLLIRRGNQLGALRILKIVPNHEIQARAGEWLGIVDYESYFSDSLSKPLVSGRKVSSELHFGIMKGFGFHYSWQSGNQRASVGPWKFVFFDQDGMFMTAVDFWHGVDDDTGLEFAATSATDVASIYPKDSKLRWYSYNNNRDIPCPEPIPAIAN